MSQEDLAPQSADGSAVSLYDARPFFEKALQHGVQHGLIDANKLDAIHRDAPKGMVQIAAYFGSEFLRPELERARERMVNLISLHLEEHCGSDVQKAAELLRDHSIMSRSKAGSDMLKRLIGMPQSTHFGMNEGQGFTDEHIPQLAKWTLRSLADYRAELASRRQAAELIEAALWFAAELDTDPQELDDTGTDAEAVLRSALLTLAVGRDTLPDWPALDKTIATLRKRPALAMPEALSLPEDLPAHLREACERVRQTVLADLPRILDATVSARKLFAQTPSFLGRYFWIEDALAEVDHHERGVSPEWRKATGGQDDEGALLTLFLHLAAGSRATKTAMTEKAAAALIRKVRKGGLQPNLATQYIRLHAPSALQESYCELWRAFLEEAQPLLLSDAVTARNDALALLRRECVVTAS